MSTKWGIGRWGTFRWGYSAELDALLAKKTGVHTRPRIIWKLDAGDQDITQYFISGGEVSQEKERAPDRLTVGDAQLTFNNKDNVFTEDNSSSFLYGVDYHNRDISFELGIQLADGSFQYIMAATMRVSSLKVSSESGRAEIRVYDLSALLIGETLNPRPSAMEAVADADNVGDGTMSEVTVKPFVTVAENWTLTCTLGGADSVATFSVVGSVSGNIGTATSGTEFLSATTGGIKFTIQVGDADWVIGDVLTFSTVKTMEWAATNPFKIIWSILTGYNYTTGSAEPWLTRTPQLDSTQSSANTKIDWASFKKAVDDAEGVLPTLKGYIPFGYKLVDAIEEILLHYLAAVYVDPWGRLVVKAYRPELGSAPKNFADSKKAVSLSCVRDVRDVINRVSVKYRKLDSWPWSDDEGDDTLDGVYVAENQTSKTALGQWYGQDFESRWWNVTADHVSFLATRIIDKYGRPPRRYGIETGIDATEATIGDIISVTDSKLGLVAYELELMGKNGNYSSKPIAITLEAEDTGTYGISWAFLGSSADEGDGLSPQAATFDTASESDKAFCYQSRTGGAGADGRDYFMF